VNQVRGKKRSNKYSQRKQSMHLSTRTRNRLRTSTAGTGFDMTADNRHTSNHYNDASITDINRIIGNSREVMQKRCRYEVRNNCYLKGIINSYVYEIVGTGPTLQMLTDNDRFNSEVEDLFNNEFALICDAGKRQDFGGMLRTGLKDTSIMGEELTTFRSVSNNLSPVQLRIQAINPLRLTTPIININSDTTFDGVDIDPVTTEALYYYIYKHHPGGQSASTEWEKIPADQILHFFFHDESEQFRGSPTIAPALPLAASLRRYTLAVVAAAEQAANISGVIQSTLGNIDPDLVAAMDEVEIARNSLLTLPLGYEAHQFKPEQPTTTYKAFKAELVAEIGRCMSMPYIVAASNAQGYNYSSGRLDLQDWWKTTAVIRHMLQTSKIEHIFYRWIAEARMIPGYFRRYTRVLQNLPLRKLKHTWNWPGHEHVDPQKEANAQGQRLTNKTTTLAEEWARKGKDWERAMEQIARETKKIMELEQQYGLPEGSLLSVVKEANQIITDNEDIEVVEDEN